MKQDTRLSQQPAGTKSRRDFLKLSGKLTAGAALAGVAIPHVHAAEDNTIRLALIGSGSRGSGAVVNAFESPNGPCKLVAMADIFPERLEGSHKALDATVFRQGRRAAGAPLRGLRRLQEGDRLPAPGHRHRHADHLSGVPPSAPRLRGLQGRERVHGEVVRHRSGRRAARGQGRRGGEEEEPQDRRRPDVPPLGEPAGTDQADPRRRAGARSN